MVGPEVIPMPLNQSKLNMNVKSSMLDVTFINSNLSSTTFKVSITLVFLNSSGNVVDDFIFGLSDRFHVPFVNIRFSDAEVTYGLPGSYSKDNGPTLSD